MPLGDVVAKCCPADDSSALTTAVAVVGWVLVIVGWWIINRNAARHANRAQDLDLVQAIEARLTDLSARAVEYYTGALTNLPVRAQEAHIKREMQSISAAIGRLHERGPRHYQLADRIMKLRGALTGGAFESHSRANIDHDHDVVRRIWLMSDRLVDDLWNAFEKAHKL